MQRNTSPSHRVDRAVESGILECCPTPFYWPCEVAGYLWELEQAVLHFNPEHPKHDKQGLILGNTAILSHKKRVVTIVEFLGPSRTFLNGCL